jgi:DNA invertase Pin-like site-specific DNA recombinase
VSVVGYARVSTDHQSLAAQHDALTDAGCERMFIDQLSGVREDRPGLAKLLDYVRAGDVVVVVALDRLGRSLSGVIRTIETLTGRGVLLRSLREGIDYSTPTGRMLAGIFAALAGYERELMHERAAAARRAARLRGRHTGRPSRLSAAQARQLRALRRRREHSRPGAQLRSLPGHGVPGAAGPGRRGVRPGVTGDVTLT